MLFGWKGIPSGQCRIMSVSNIALEGRSIRLDGAWYTLVLKERMIAEVGDFVEVIFDSQERNVEYIRKLPIKKGSFEAS